MSLVKHFIHFKRVHVLVRQTTTRLVQKAGRIEMIRVFRLDALNLWELRCVFFTLDQLFKILCWTSDLGNLVAGEKDLGQHLVVENEVVGILLVFYFLKNLP